jgi:hypothetical protein
MMLSPKCAWQCVNWTVLHCAATALQRINSHGRTVLKHCRSGPGRWHRAPQLGGGELG